jgi:beta-glucuronidase
MLRPQDNGVRESKRLDGLWDFVIDRRGIGRAQEWWRGSLPDARPLPVPASFNDILVSPDAHDHVGDVWYQRMAFVPAGWSERRVRLRFDAATHRATVWVNDTQVAFHEGGYTPFEADITDEITPGQPIRITVVVNNELSWESIPPGVVQQQLDGSRRQRYYHDFFNYAGLHRSVWLRAIPETHIEDVTVVTELRRPDAVLHYTAAIQGDPSVELHAGLYDAAGALVAEGRGAQAELRLSEPHLWAPGDGYLYDLRLELTRENRLIDRYCLPVGIRSVRVDGTQFLINDKPFYFRGFGKHEDLAIRGRGHDDVAMVHDFELLRWVGANSFRTSHYPYAEEVLDLADRLGIVIIDETAAVGLNLGIGGGLFRTEPVATFSDKTIGAVAQRHHEAAIAELIARDKNHPCVVLWSLANEPESHTEESRAYFEPLFARARQLDATRPVGFVNMMLAPPDRCLVTDLADVVMINRYYGWYVEPGELALAEQMLEAELRGWVDKHGKPILVTEYGADAMPGLHSVGAEPWTEDYQAALLETYHRVFDRVDAVVGEHVWNFADFATAPSIIRVEGNKKGVFTRDRRPKAAAHLLRRRWRDGG